MKILHINDYFINSWAEQIYRNIFDKLWWEKISIDDYIFKNNILKLFNKFFFSFKLYFKIKEIIKIYKPDTILIHNINLSPFSVLFAIKKHKNIIQVVHDATQAWCPSWWCIYRKNYKDCNIKMSYLKCSKYCAYDKSKIWFFIYYFWLKIFLILKKKIIKKYISPSVALKNILTKNNFKKSVNLWNPILYNDLENNIEKENILLYVWAIDKRKWIDKLIEAIDELDFLKQSWKFYIIWNWEIYNELKNKYKDDFYKFLWKIPNEEVIKYYEKWKIVFVSSLWFDNYPTVALEWIFNNNIVLWTKNWGFKEMTWEKNIFDIFDKKSIQDKIIEVTNNYELYYKENLIYKEKLKKQIKSYYEDLSLILNK